MADDTNKGAGHVVDGPSEIIFADITNAKDMAPLTNKSGGSVVTGDVLVQDTTTNLAFTTTTTAGDLRPVFVVPSEVAGATPTASTKTILNNELGWVFKAGAYVPLATVDGAVTRGDYLKTSGTAKKFTTTGIQVAAGTVIPPGSCAIALSTAAGAGQIPVLLTPTSTLKYDMEYICVKDQKAQNTAGGTFTQADWRTRDLNTEHADTGSLASVAANQITLAAGTYRVSWRCPAHAVNNHQTRLYDTTGAAVLVLGESSYCFDVNVAHSLSCGSGRFTLAVQSVLELQHYCSTTNADDGFGLAANITTEVYSVIEFWSE